MHGMANLAMEGVPKGHLAANQMYLALDRTFVHGLTTLSHGTLAWTGHLAGPVAIVEELPGHLVVAAVAELFPAAVSSVCFAAGSFAERVAAAGLALGQVVYPFAKPIGSCSHQSWVQFLWL